MTKITDSALALYRKAHQRASEYMERASAWLLLSAVALIDAINNGEIVTSDGNAFPRIVDFTADDRKALAGVLIAQAGCDAAAESKAAAKFKGNVARVREISKEFRTRRNAATRDIIPALTIAALEKYIGGQPMCDFNKGRISIPAAWFLPPNAADASAQALLATNPITRMLEPTSTSERAEIAYFTVDGFAAFQREYARWKEAGGSVESEPQPDDYCAIVKVGVNATGLIEALEAFITAREAARKADEARATAEAKAAEAKAAESVVAAAQAANVDAATLRASQQAAEAARKAAEAAAQQAAEAEQAAENAKTRAPRGKVTQGEPAVASDSENDRSQVMTVSSACDFLANVAMREDGKAKFAPSVIEAFAHLASAIWYCPVLAKVFLDEREAMLKESAASAKRA